MSGEMAIALAILAGGWLAREWLFRRQRGARSIFSRRRRS
jgi:hypothetical protein